MYINEETMTVIDEKTTVNTAKQIKTIEVPQEGAAEEKILIVRPNRSFDTVSVYTKDIT